MDVPGNAADLAMTFEGFYAKAYRCPAGIPTIGFGAIRYMGGKRVSLSDPPITMEQAEEMLAFDLRDALQDTIRVCPILATVPSTWLGAIVDFVFNFGSGRLQTSTLRRKINAELWDDVPVELNRWVYGGGRKLKGLVLRREAEGAFYG